MKTKINLWKNWCYSFWVVIALSALLSIISCGEAGGGNDEVYDEPKTVINPFNILSYEPKTNYSIDITSDEIALRTIGQKTRVSRYETGLPGGMIIVPRNQELNFHVTNHDVDSTSLHWHGLRVPYDQDGPGKMIDKNNAADFTFTLNMTGTHWYHPHMRPILPQLNAGLYAPFIVKEDYDSKYAGDYVLTLDDWYLGSDNQLDSGSDSHGSMDVTGSLETVNKQRGSDIYPITLKQGEIVKLRFINASTSQYHTISMEGHTFRVTHLDGHYLQDPYTVNNFRLAAGERVDVELKGIKNSGTYYIRNGRSYGIRIPVIYEGIGEEMESPFVPGPSEAFPNIESQPVDHEYHLNSGMNGGSGGHEGGGSMLMEWYINNVAYLDGSEPIDIQTVSVDTVYKFRFINEEGSGMMHSTVYHPMHLHGGHFQVVSLNGTPPPRETFKDTQEIPPLQYVDIAVKFYNPGDWMLHCHIIDHEDNGMLTIIHAE
ncbi:multicopper oxidase family protein [Leadbettera azotonutricia]|uniref:LcoC n=1 Tax=Leadbettera azotonutricia (strain ATCC BAA-888 / DSM 13862 / ZAS-9) TaxID=545695 RepID=F5Y724_LEAAZ|nr:multicopper oxidase family protein [Leadbettera azotonutricia]AEF81354.1 LcoC [Leadbettera azotonutricia ZAS-9]